ncbi:MAG: ribonucleotide reductase subunit alpha, partial [Eggerthella lenta]|nr:ribonucleotide reductase subunit alpha [Eggerthella lenta]
MFENDANSSPSQNDEHSNSSTEYLRLASQACASGDAVLGMHLYLAAFERAQHGEGSAVDEAALEGLKQAWQLACKLKERSIAEYAFERLEPYLSSDEAAACA